MVPCIQPFGSPLGDLSNVTNARYQAGISKQLSNKVRQGGHEDKAEDC